MNTNHGTKILGFWETDSRGGSYGSLLIFLILIFLAICFDPVWRPFLNYYTSDFIPLRDYEPYTP
jgi:hypothetical protein